MADFLSDAWIAELALACRGALLGDGSSTTSFAPFAIEPVVRDVPGRGEVRYRIVFTDATCTLIAGGTPDEADVHLETDYVTAVALSRGTANAQAALADGRMRISGDVARLAEHAAALARIDDLFAALREATTYPPP